MFSECLASINGRMWYLQSANEPEHCQNELKTSLNVEIVHKAIVTCQSARYADNVKLTFKKVKTLLR